jgi:allantoinase
MSTLDLILANGTLATSTQVLEADIGIADGKIAVIGERGSLQDAPEIIDAKGKTILPGGIDTHVHGGDPGGFDRLGIDFGETTKAAALGGITTTVDMPMQNPATTSPEAFDVKMESIKPRACTDFALWATYNPGDLESIMPLAEKGVVGYKLVMHESVAGIMPHHHDGIIVEALEEIKKTGLVTTIHAESQDMILYLEQKLKAEGRNDPRAFLDCHPAITELEAINRILFIADRLGARINIAHCGVAEGIAMINRARSNGQPVTVETCIHYLTLDESIFDTKGTLPKLAPPLRSRDQVDMMWQKLAEGKIDCVASDHVPYPLSFKSEDIWECSAGSPGVQTMLPLLISEGVNKGRIDLSQLVKVMSEGPAKICGLYPKKGSTQIGADADFAVFDLNAEKKIRLEEQIGLEWTLYEGMKAIYPDIVLVRGKSIVDKGEFVGEKGYGEFCSPLGAPSLE